MRGGVFFVRPDPDSTTPKMFLSFGDKQASKEKAKEMGRALSECLTHHLVRKTYTVFAIAKTLVFVKISHFNKVTI